MRPETDVPHNFEHFAAFCATGVLFGLVYSRKSALAAVALVLWAGMIEIVQIFVPGRHERLSDFIVDTLAVCIGVALASFAARALGQSS